MPRDNAGLSNSAGVAILLATMSERGRYTVDEWQIQKLDERLREQDLLAPGYAERFGLLRKRILQNNGGATVVPPLDLESDLDDLLARGCAFYSEVRLRKMAVSRCHTNVVRLWLKGLLASIATGYALADDGLWRQHSWGIDKKQRVVETSLHHGGTLIVDGYYGFVLNDAESQKFVAANPPG